jgi:ribonuclease HI
MVIMFLRCGLTVEDALNIYTDGSSFQSPRVGGIGIRFIKVDSLGNEQITDYYPPGYKNATNNQMELQACIVALKEVIKNDMDNGISRVVIFTDSLYVVDNISNAKYKWPKYKWFLDSGQPVLNAEQWIELVKLIKKIGKRVEFKWVEGHSKDVHNKAVDKIAKQSAKSPLNKPISVVKVRRKKTTESVNLGSVVMCGQRVSIRIVTSEYLPVQKLNKYKYEVIAKASKYYRCVDIIYSEIMLRAGHSYYVKVNNNKLNPRIEKLFKEIVKKSPAS